MTTYTVKDIPPASFFSKPVFLDDNFIIVAPEMPFSEEIRKLLLDWDFKELHSEGVQIAAAVKPETTEETSPLENSTLSDGLLVKRAEEFYLSFQKYVETLFTRIAIKGDVDFKSVAEKVKGICEIVKEDRRFLLRAIKTADSGNTDNFLAAHAIKSAIISIVIGVYIKLPNHRLIELGVAALLHEIGMIKLPPQIYLAKRQLSPQERKAILTHPILSFNMLKSFDFPLTISLAALEHHEREDGTGYPQKLTGDKISLYAKIIAVACSYEAITSARPHKDANDGYVGMLDLLKNVGKQYDDTIVRALVYSLSIYPIGLYVMLSNGRKGQVVDVNPENPRFPIVQLFGENTPDGKVKTIETSPTGISIVRPLMREEMDPKK